MTPREFCQEQLRLLGDEELIPAAQAASLEILHSTILKDPDAPTFEAQLRSLAGAAATGEAPPGGAPDVARVLLDAWLERGS
jgi:hypothetical protein